MHRAICRNETCNQDINPLFLLTKCFFFAINPVHDKQHALIGPVKVQSEKPCTDAERLSLPGSSWSVVCTPSSLVSLAQRKAAACKSYPFSREKLLANVQVCVFQNDAWLRKRWKSFFDLLKHCGPVHDLGCMHRMWVKLQLKYGFHTQSNKDAYQRQGHQLTPSATSVTRLTRAALLR